MHIFHVNVLAVFLAAFLCMGIGALWYSKALFVKPWMEALGKKMEDLQPKNSNYVFCFISFFITAFVFAKIAYYARISDLWGNIELALLVWIGFVFTSAFVSALFESKPLKVVLINTGSFLAYLLAISIVTGLWK